MMSSDTDSKHITLQKSNVLLLGPTGSGNPHLTKDCSSTDSLFFLLSLIKKSRNMYSMISIDKKDMTEGINS